jgi:uroporphyrinogen-III decarboxylase
MQLPPRQSFLVDLLSPDRPHPGHGVRVNAFGSRYLDVQTLVHGDLEDRAQLGKRMLEMDLLSLEVIKDDRAPMLHCWSGTEVFAAAYGCDVFRPDDEMPFALPVVRTAAEADRLEEPDIWRGPLGEIFALGDRLVELCGSEYPVRICDIQSPLDIAALIWEKEAFFIALHEEPEAVHRLLRKVTDTLTTFVRAFLARYDEVCLVHWPDIWMPSEWGICVSEDEIGSISSATFREFGLPYLRELAETFGGISLHSCAAGQHHWEDLATLPGIRYLNFSHPATDLQASIDRFSGHAVLVPVVFPGLEYGLDFVDDCLARARPDTRFFFRTDVEGLDAAVAMAGEIKRRSGRTSLASEA